MTPGTLWGESLRQRKALFWNVPPDPVGQGVDSNVHLALQRLLCAPVIDQDQVRMVAAVGNSLMPYANLMAGQVSLAGELGRIGILLRLGKRRRSA